MRNRDRRWAWAVVAIVLVGTLSGCATRKYVRTEVEASDGRTSEGMNQIGGDIDQIESQVEANQSRLAQQGAEMGEISGTAAEALERAIAAGKLAEGKFVYETTLTDDKVKFGFDTADLGEGAAMALDEFAAALKQENANVFVEIQGHTDATGSDAYNLELGRERAEAVRRYLNRAHQVPLHRMSVISYGETAPTADNSVREGRSRNRRVVLVVLK